MKDINDLFKIGDTVIVGGRWVNPLLNYEGQIKEAQEPMAIDINWGPPRMWIERPRTENTKVFLHKGDRLTILSKAFDPPEGCVSYLFKIQDKDDNQYYLSCEWFDLEK